MAGSWLQDLAAIFLENELPRMARIARI